MPKKISAQALLFIATLALLCNIHTQAKGPSYLDDGLMGWATQNPNGSPTGGAGEDSISCTASNQAEFLDCVIKMHDVRELNKPFTLYIQGLIDGALNDDGSGYTRINLERSNLSIIGLTKNEQPATIRANWIYTRGKENLIIRNLRIIPGRDHKLKSVEEGCPIQDTDFCDWNAKPDALTVQATQGVWIDHCEFTDGSSYEGANPNKSHYKTYDGLLDIKRGANYVTVSYSKFSNHDKSILIGHSDKHDSDNFHVTFYRNHFKNLGQRAPRVRYGKVHLLNNLYTNVKKKHFYEKYHLSYAIGVAYKSEIYSEKNVFDIKGATAKDIVDISDFSKWGQYFTDTGSWLNGKATDLNSAAKENINTKETLKKKGLHFIGPVTWSPTSEYNYQTLDNQNEVRKVIKLNAGAGIDMR